MSAAAISATFSDWRTVKGRKQLQLIFEVPLEQQGEILSYLGAPVPDDPRWVAIALLNTGPVKAEMKGGLQAPSLPPQGRAAETKLTAKERYAALPPEKQAIADAAMLADDVSFQMWATERAYAMGLKFDTAKDFIHDRCAVASCSEFATDPRALQRWNGFRAVFDEWRRG